MLRVACKPQIEQVGYSQLCKIGRKGGTTHSRPIGRVPEGAGRQATENAYRPPIPPWPGAYRPSSHRPEVVPQGTSAYKLCPCRSAGR